MKIMILIASCIPKRPVFNKIHYFRPDILPSVREQDHSLPVERSPSNTAELFSLESATLEQE